jgi:hypothetical protein
MRKLSLAAILALAGCTSAPPAKTTADLLADMERGQAEISLIGPLADCLKPPLSAAQKEYLTGGIGNYKIQRYLMAVGTSNDEAACQLRAVQFCERVTPGQCIAQQ